MLNREEFEREGTIWCRPLRCELYASLETYKRERALRPVPECFLALGLDADATADEVKRAYRRLAKLHHSDNGGDPAEFKKVRQFYEQAMARSA